jgi:L-threonylcarbamoyladenylate synthase
MTPSPEVEKAPEAAPSREIVDRVEAVLARGGLVALPTETVYGIAARADLPKAVVALRELKTRPGDLALTWHVGTRQAIQRFPGVSVPARRLADRYWPGPLTLVLPGIPAGLEAVALDGWTGVRMPAHRATAGILERLPFPVVLSSANRHGDPPLSTAEAVVRAFPGAPKLELVIDGGPAALSESSCVLRVGRGRFEILREGLISLEQLRAAAGLHLGFVCTGNTCRSPMAEGLAKKRIADRMETTPERLAEFGYRIESMGVLAGHGVPAARLAIQVMKEEGVDLGEHRSRAAAARDLASFDNVYCMTAGHREALARTLPPGKDRNLELLDPQGRDIPDPIGGTREDYLEALRMIRDAVEARLPAWA